MKRIPLNAFQKALYNRLCEQVVPVYDQVPAGEEIFPCITFGAFTSKHSGAKCVDMAEVTINIDIWTETAGRKSVNEIANAVINVLQFPLVLDDDFICIDLIVDFFECFPNDDYGYHGVITLAGKIQNIK